MAEDVDAIVIGAGEAGAVVANLAMEAGQRVAMIYKPPYGSTCVNTGCVPSKFLIHRARVAHLVRTAARFHIQPHEPQLDLAALVREKDEIIAHHREEALEGARIADRLTLLEGEARFTSPHEVTVADHALRADKIFIATGMRPSVPPIDGLDQVPVLTNESLMDLTELPEHLVVVGGGYVGCELGQAFRRYGSEVTVIQSRDHLCPAEEPDVSTLLERAFRAEGIELLLGHRVAHLQPGGMGVRVVARAGDGSERAVQGSHVLMATGRRPNTEMLQLADAGVDTDERGFVKVDDELQTTAAGVWAVGDVNGHQPFTRVCQEEAKVAYANAFDGTHTKIERLHLGHAVFTDPEIGSVGLTEQQARERELDVAAGLVTFDQVEKAEIIGETTGLIKYVVDRKTRRLLGCHVIGPGGADLVYDATLVMRHGGTLDEIAKTVGVFPTVQEGMEGTARGLLRRIAPDEVRGPLATGPVNAGPAAATDHGQEDEQMAKGFACPACAAELEVSERLPAQEQQAHREEKPEVAPRNHASELACPACGADLEVRSNLSEEGQAGEPR